MGLFSVSFCDSTIWYDKTGCQIEKQEKIYFVMDLLFCSVHFNVCHCIPFSLKFIYFVAMIK